MSNFTQTPEDHAGLSTRENVVLAVAILFSLAGTLVGLAGLLMWGIRASEMLFPGSGDAPAITDSLAPYYTIAHFVLTVLITAWGILNLMNATRGREFFEGGWKRWLGYSALSAAAAAAFFAIPT